MEVLAAKMIALKPLTGKDEKAEKHVLNKVNRFLIDHDTWPESVVVSLPRSHVTFKTFELPAPDLDSVRSMVEFELERQSIGAYLRGQRRLRGIGIEELAELTRIPTRSLERLDDLAGDDRSER
ncbi:MAG: hypothetical protein IH918_07545 [Acidobacteria bacterium]|nr:hypothetical protein [Acidobacteriota bacterium]